MDTEKLTKATKKSMLKQPKFWLIVALCLCLISMVGASLVQTSGGTVKIEKIRIIGQEGVVVNGEIFIPRWVTTANPVPLIVCQHGSFNSFEMQEPNFVELSRRGFVVATLDAYRHGSSSMVAKSSFGNAWVVIDSMIATLDIIQKDNIGLIGHSLGGMIMLQTVNHYLTLEAQGKGKNPITAFLECGYDPSNSLKVTGVANPVPYTINYGVLAAKYDEWFFKSKDVNQDPRRLLESDEARNFVNSLTGVKVTGSVENGKLYKGKINGKDYIRVVYQNNEIHPWNNFSMEAAREASTFFYAAMGTPKGATTIDPTNEIWQWKAFFNGIGLIGILLMMYPLGWLLINQVAWFRELKSASMPPPAPALKTPLDKGVHWGVYLLNTIIPPFLVMPVMFQLVGKSSFSPGTVTPWFGQPNTNELAGWTVAVCIVLLITFLLSYFLYGRKHGVSIDSWGIKVKPRILWKSFVLGVLVVTVAYIILYFADAVFYTDFRWWQAAMRILTYQKIPFVAAYFPAFALFYLINSMLVNGGNRVEGRPTWKVTVMSCFSNIAGILALIIIQYIGIVNSGTYAFNSMRICNLFTLVVYIPVGTIVTQRYFKETGKIYAGSFAISLLYTMITVGNTSASSTLFK